MARKKGLLMAAAAFASSPQGRRIIQQAKDYASRPENRQKAQQLMSQARSRKSTGRGYGPPPA